jgi:hypothetical protein
MAVNCPICGNGTLKKSDKYVCCSNHSVEKNEDGSFSENGCGFKIFFDQKKYFGRMITPGDVKTMVEGGEITSPKKHKMRLDLTSNFFTRIEFAPKAELEDL